MDNLAGNSQKRPDYSQNIALSPIPKSKTVGKKTQ